MNLAVVLFFMLRGERAPPAGNGARRARGRGTRGERAVGRRGRGAGARAAGRAAIAARRRDDAGGAAGDLLRRRGDAAARRAGPDPDAGPPVSSPSVVYDDAPPTQAPATDLPQGLPELSVDLHVFAADPAKRAVFINGRRYTQGAQIAEGPVVEEITREGAVLSWRGRRFVLPRL